VEGTESKLEKTAEGVIESVSVDMIQKPDKAEPETLDENQRIELLQQLKDLQRQLTEVQGDGL